MIDGYLTEEQIKQMMRGIHPSRVAVLDGMSHVEAWDIRAHLNRIFGFARWSADLTDLHMIYEQETTTRAGKPAYKVAYRATVRLAVCSPEEGALLASYTEAAAGESLMPDFKRADCHDMAIKTAESQAFKRCAVNLGTQFGLSLYRDGETDDVVRATLVGMPEPDPADNVA